MNIFEYYHLQAEIRKDGFITTSWGNFVLLDNLVNHISDIFKDI